MASTRKTAPLDMVSQFLKAVKAKHYDSALQLSNDILSFEPNNSVILAYRPILTKAVDASKTPPNETNSESEESDESGETDEEDTGTE